MNLLNNWYKHYRWRSSPLNPQRDVARISIDQLYERLHTMFGHKFFEIPEPTKIGTMSTNWLHYLLASRRNSSLVPLWEFHTLVEVAERYFPDIHKRLQSYKKDTWKMQDTLFEVFAARWLHHNRALIRDPRGCIEYVIVHELCLLLNHDHGAKFQALQARESPAWAKWKRGLEEKMV